MNSKVNSMGLSSIKPFNKQHVFSLHQLSKWNQQLDNERLKTQYAQQDLKKQKKIAKENNIFIKKQVISIQQQAISLTKQLQEQKTKHEHLIALVKKLEEQIYEDKLSKYEDVMNKKQPDQFEEHKKTLIQKQKKLQKILQKLNSSQFQISKKVDSIRSLRSQRGIHSNVFDKLQRQYFDVEFYYKQLLIQRTLIDKQLQKNINQFNLVYQKSHSESNQFKYNQQKQQKSYSIQIQQLNQGLTKNQIYSKKDHITLRVPQLHFDKNNQIPTTERFKSKHDLYTSKVFSQKNMDQVKKLDFKKKLKQVLNDLGCSNFQDVIKKNIIHKIHTQQKSFQDSDHAYDQVFKVQNDIKRLEKQLHQRKSIRQHVFSTKKMNLHSQISQFQIEAEQAKAQINSFKSDFNKILNHLVIDQKNEKPFSINNLVLIDKDTDSQNLTFSQNHQILKEMMAFFNDQFLDSYLHGMKNNQISRSKIFQEKGLIKKKNKKLSSINFQKKVKILRTETQNSHQSSYSIRNSQCLDAILNMHLGGNQKVEKSQKIDTLSIMTEQQLIEQSKRLIRQVNKKKSEFLSVGSVNKR